MEYNLIASHRFGAYEVNEWDQQPCSPTCTISIKDRVIAEYDTRTKVIDKLRCLGISEEEIKKTDLWDWGIVDAVAGGWFETRDW